MTRNILIATIFTLATAVLLGFVFINESSRLPRATAAITAEQLERGARDYEQYCASCHGIAGQGEVASGAPRINNLRQKYFTPDANGVVQFEQPNGIKDKYGTLRNYVEATLYSGIRGAPMPAFGATGTMRQDQIENVAAYILSWDGNVPPAAQTAAALEATRIAPTPDPNANPVTAGQIVFNNRGCNSCHNMNDQKLVGPGLGGLFQPGGTAAYGEQLPNGEPINDETVYDWIIKGTAGFPNHIDPLDGETYGPMPGFPNVTPEDYEKMAVWLKAHNRDGSLTEEAQRIIEEAQGAPPAQQTTAQPTNQPNQPAAPNSPAGPGSTATP